MFSFYSRTKSPRNHKRQKLLLTPNWHGYWEIISFDYFVHKQQKIRSSSILFTTTLYISIFLFARFACISIPQPSAANESVTSPYDKATKKQQNELQQPDALNALTHMQLNVFGRFDRFDSCLFLCFEFSLISFWRNKYSFIAFQIKNVYNQINQYTDIVQTGNLEFVFFFSRFSVVCVIAETLNIINIYDCHW